MSESSEVPVVFIDTNIFDANKFDFNNRMFRWLKSLAQRGSIRIVVCDVVDGECVAHIKNELDDINKNLVKLKKESKKLGLVEELQKIEELDIEQVSQVKMQNFYKDANAEILQTSELVSTEELMKLYFEKSVPFDKEDKKSEFPDAICLLAIQKFLEDEEESVFVLSNDGDWIRFFENTSKVECVKSIADLLKCFKDDVVSIALKRELTYQAFVQGKLNDKLIDLIKSNIELDDFDLDFVSGFECEVELEGVDCLIAAPEDENDLEVFEFEEDLNLRIKVLAKLQFDISHRIMHYDGIDGDYITLDSYTDSIDSDHMLDISCKVQYNGEGESIDFDKLIFDEVEISVDRSRVRLGEIGLSDEFYH